jgi:mRNA-degrading endonuclease toxin of MazEF toxin-antitoxin module
LATYHWVELPDRGGREQSGKRPAIIWQDTTAFPQLPTVLVIPLSSQQSALRFGGTMLLQPTPINGLSVPLVALIFQLGACEIRRIGQRIGKMSAEELVSIQAIARKLQKGFG